MPCYRPRTGYRSKHVNPDTGKRSIVFNPHDGYVDLPQTVSCGQCIGCRLERSRQWAIRCLHESQLHPQNCFITLTYDNAHLPPLGTLVLEDYQKFMKRLRKRYGEGIRFFHCGEYGEKFARPHYHACLFNFDFEDKTLFSVKKGNRLYISQSLSELWPFGFSTIGDVTFQSAAYVARYITKKINGKQALQHYEVVDQEDGEIMGRRRPEYVTMSRRPGIGREWLNKFTEDVYPSDFIVINGKKMKPPKYYDLNFEIENPELFAKVKLSREQRAELNKEHSTPERLDVREEIQQRRFKKLIRSYENGG